jgi:hypothetical protein
MVRNARLGIGLAAVWLPAFLAGCGGGASTAPSERPESSTEPAPDFASEADRLCAAAQAEQEVLRRERGGDQLTLDDRARLLVELAPSRVRLGERLAALEPPAGPEQATAELVAAAERRGRSSTQAGERWERGAAEARIAAAAAGEHEQRLRFVGIAGELGLSECAEVLSSAQRRRIVTTIERGLTSADPIARCGAFGERFRQQEYGGGVAACADSAPRTPLADGVSVDRIDGMDEVFAVAQVATVGGDAPGSYRARIVFEDGAYRIDKLD